MRLIGIDPGTAQTGFAIIELFNNEPKIVEVSCIYTSKDQSMHHRLKMLYFELSNIVAKHKPEVMVLEKLFFNTNAKTAISVGQARGMSMLVAADHNLSLFEYTALEAKHVLTGYGRASKKQMQDAVKYILKLEDKIKPDDANDAVAIALCYLEKDCLIDAKLEKYTIS